MILKRWLHKRLKEVNISCKKQGLNILMKDMILKTRTITIYIYKTIGSFFSLLASPYFLILMA